MRFLPGQGPVDRSQLPVDDTHRPPIADDMVHHQYKYMIVFIESQHGAANPGRGGEVERPSKLLGHQPIDFRVALLDGQRGQVDPLDRNRPTVLDHLNRPAVDDLDESPEDLVSLDHDVERLFQEPDVKSPPETDRIPLVISAHTGVQLLEEPESLLGGREGASRGAVPGGNSPPGRSPHSASGAGFPRGPLGPSAGDRGVVGRPGHGLPGELRRRRQVARSRGRLAGRRSAS